MTVTISDLRARVETDFDDPTLQRILSGVVEEIERRAGTASPTTETQRPPGRDFISLPRRAVTVDSIDERRTLESDPVTLDAADWRRSGDYQIYRVATTWGAEIVVSYTPEVDAELRDRSTLDIAQMDIEFRALDEEEAGDYKQMQKDYKRRRNALFKQIREGRSPAL